MDNKLQKKLSYNALNTSKHYKWSIIADKVMKYYLKVLNN